MKPTSAQESADAVDVAAGVPPPEGRSAASLFDMHRRTWEIELLISGAMVFALLRVPSWADRLFDRIEVHVSKDLFLLPYMGYYAVKISAYVLIIAFVSHLLGRAYWVGLIGLDAAFPRGVDWSKTGLGPRVNAFYRRSLPNVKALIGRTDRICSSIFSVCFFFLILMGYISVLFLLLSPVALAIDRLAFSGRYFPIVVLVLVYALLLPVLAAVGLDKVARRKWPRLARSRFFRGFVRNTLGAFYRVSPLRLILPIQFTFLSHYSKKVINTFTFTVIIGLGVLFVASLLLNAGAVRFDSYLYFHDDMAELGVDSAFYEDQRPAGEIFKYTPSIPSDIVKDPYVKLFIPYSPRYNDDVARACPDVAPLRSEGFALSLDSTVEPDERAAALGCLASLYEIRLDGEVRVDLDFFFFRHPETDVRGIITYLDTEGLSRGRHLLELRRLHHDEDLRERRKKYSIPFWL